MTTGLSGPPWVPLGAERRRDVPHTVSRSFYKHLDWPWRTPECPYRRAAATRHKALEKQCHNQQENTPPSSGLSSHPHFVVQFDQKVFASEAQFADFGPAEGVDFGVSLEKKYRKKLILRLLQQTVL